MLLNGKSAIITGGARGLGLAIAETFLREGAKVIIADVLDEAGAAAAERLSGEIAYRHCDVTKKAEVEALVAAAVEAHGRLDIAVANAGIVHVSDPLELSEADFQKVIDVNLKGVFLTGQAAAKQMLKQAKDADGARGSIINMSSVNAELTIPEIAPYVMSKGGVRQWTRALAIRLAQEGIRVNAIGPGSIATEMFASVASDPGKLRNVLSRTPMGRAGEPDEIGKVAAFLASDLASYVTGETVYVDGGRMGLNYLVPVLE
jgi:NAD(P)-dependent dehydrogenase (short-subunit alcohol dehydrogenase family)